MTMTIKMPKVILKMLSSKKILVALIGVALLLIRQHTTWLSGWDVLDIVKPIGGYLFAQGLEDFGKSGATLGHQTTDIVATLRELFGQRKTGLMLTQLMIGFSNQFFPGLIDDNTATWAINLLMGSTVAVGVADFKKATPQASGNGYSNGKIAEQKMMEALG